MLHNYRKDWTNKTIEQRLRRRLERIGFKLHRSRKHKPTTEDQCGYRIDEIGIYFDKPVAGENFNLSLEEVADFQEYLTERFAN